MVGARAPWARCGRGHALPGLSVGTSPLPGAGAASGAAHAWGRPAADEGRAGTVAGMTAAPASPFPDDVLWCEPDGFEYGWRWPNGDYAWWSTRHSAVAHPRGLCGPGAPVRRAAPIGPGPILEGHDPAPAASDVDVDALPPTQQLVLEVLAARARTGERLWTFPATGTHRKALKALEALGLVGFKGGVNQGTVLAWLTDTGSSLMRSDSYIPPDFVDHFARITGYVIYPDDCPPQTSPVDVAGYAVRVEAIGSGRWQVLHGDKVLSVDGELEDVPDAASRDPQWAWSHQFDRDGALHAARKLANEVTVTGLRYTAALKRAHVDAQ